MVDSDPALRELRTISKILLLSNSQAVKKEIEKICTSDGRKKMWVLCDGKHMPKDMVAEAGLSVGPISTFLNVGVAAGLIEYEKGEPPRRLLDYVPPEWIELIQGVESTLEVEQPSSSESLGREEERGEQLE